MSRFGDSRDPNGPGFLILQDHGYARSKVPDHGRGSLVGVRVVGRRDQTGEYGQWIEDEFARGPIGGGFFWQRTKENAGAWRFAWGSVTATYGPTSADPAAVGGGEFQGPVGAVDPDSRVQSDIPPKPGEPDWEQILADLYAGRIRDKDGGPMDPAAFRWHVAAVGAQAAIQGAQKDAKDLVAAAAAGQVGGGGAIPNQPNVQVGVGGIIWGGQNAIFGLGVNPFGVNFQVNGAQFGNPNAVFGIGVGGFPEGGVRFVYNANLVQQANEANRRGNRVALDDKKNDASDEAVKSWSSLDEPEVEVPTQAYPVESRWLPDRRYVQQNSVNPVGWPTFPRGYYGITLPSSIDSEQTTQWYPADPRLIAANKDGPSTMGTPVADMGGANYSLDYTRQAPLQSLLWVVKAPKGSKGMLSANGKAESPRNWLARNIGPSGQWDVCGGLVADIPTGRNGTIARGSRILAMESCIYGGPFDVGHYGDIHQLGKDADGRPINSLHISTDALFKMRGDLRRDGPLEFHLDYPEADKLDFPIEVYCAFDGATGMWRRWTTVITSIPTPTITPRNPDRPPGEKTPKHPGPSKTAPPPGGGEDPPGGEGDPGIDDDGRPDEDPGHYDGEDWHTHPYTPDRNKREVGDGKPTNPQICFSGLTARDMVMPSVTFRPQLMVGGETDLRFTHRPTIAEHKWNDENSPITLRIDGWGAQGGNLGGPYLPGGEWSYTQPPNRSRHVGGVAAGGALILPAAVDMQNIDDDFAPAGVTVDEVFFAAGPSASFGWGIPELSTGGLRDGMSSTVESGDLCWYTHDSNGVKTKVMTFGGGGLALNVVSYLATGAVQPGEDVILTTGTITVTLPDAPTYDGRVVHVKKTDTSATTLTIDTVGETIDGDAFKTVTSQYTSLMFVSDGTNWNII